MEITNSYFHAMDFHERDIGVLPESETVEIGDYDFIGLSERIQEGCQ